MPNDKFLKYWNSLWMYEGHIFAMALSEKVFPAPFKSPHSSLALYFLIAPMTKHYLVNEFADVVREKKPLVV